MRLWAGHIWPISIHALREEGDLVALSVAASGTISIHALREEGDVPGIMHSQFKH